MFETQDCITRQHLPGRVAQAGETETRSQPPMQLPSQCHNRLAHTIHISNVLRRGTCQMEQPRLCSSDDQKRVQELEASLEWPADVMVTTHRTE